MKGIVFFFFYGFILNTYSQYRAQIKANLSIATLNYNRGFNIGFESINKLWNYSVDYISFSNFNEIKSDILKIHGQFIKIRSNETNQNIGIQFGINKLVKKNTNLNVKAGAKCFLGAFNNGLKTEKFSLDSSKFGWDWKPNLKDEKYIVSKGLSTGFIIFSRIETKLTNRFYFIPELTMPLILNYNKEKIAFYFVPGFTLSMSYCFLSK